MTREDGFTLVEVLVTVILLSVVAFITFQFFDSTTSLSGRTNKNIEAEKDAQVALRTLTQDIRAAKPISATYPTTGTCPAGVTFTSSPTGYPNCLRFTIVRAITTSFCLNPEVGRVNAPYTRYTYGLVNGRVLQDRTEFRADCTIDSSRSSTGRVIIENVVNTSAQPLFRYYGKSGAEVAPVTAATVVNASSVKVELFLKYRADVPVLKLASVASLRNNRGVEP